MNLSTSSFLGALAAFLVTAPVPVLNAQTEVLTVARSEVLDLSGARLVVRNEAGEERQVLPMGTNKGPSHRIRVGADDTVTCIGEGIWCPELAAPVDGFVELPLFDRASFTMPLDLPAGERWAGEELLVEFWIRSERRLDDAAPPWTQTDRFVVEATAADTTGRLMAVWSGPAGALDFRIAAEGWAPAYLFDVEARQDEVILPRTKLVRGSSFSVFAVDGETGAAVPGVAVALRLPDAEFDDERARRLRHSGTTNNRGFVQLQGIPSGIYDLVLTSEGRPPTPVSDIELTDGAETWRLF